MNISAPKEQQRTQWRAAAPTGRIVGMSFYDTLVVHHAAGYRANDLVTGRAQLRAIQNYHQQNKGWVDIGYQFAIDSMGTIYQGRPYIDGTVLADKPRIALGAHVKNRNTGKIGICLLGCYHPPAKKCNDKLTKKSLRQLTRLSAFLCQNYGIDPTRIMAHRDFQNTACPGDTVYQQIKILRRKVLQLLD